MNTKIYGLIYIISDDNIHRNCRIFPATDDRFRNFERDKDIPRYGAFYDSGVCGLDKLGYCCGGCNVLFRIPSVRY